MSLTRFRAAGEAHYRLRYDPGYRPRVSRIAEYYNINQAETFVPTCLAEHGDSSFVPWSGKRISSSICHRYVEEFDQRGHTGALSWCIPKWDHIRKSGSKIIEAQEAATFYAVAVSCNHICKCIFSG